MRTVIDCCCCCSVAKLCLTLWPPGMQHARLFCPPLSPRVCSNAWSWSQWFYLTISSSAVPFSSGDTLFFQFKTVEYIEIHLTWKYAIQRCFKKVKFGWWGCLHSLPHPSSLLPDKTVTSQAKDLGFFYLYISRHRLDIWNSVNG